MHLTGTDLVPDAFLAQPLDHQFRLDPARHRDDPLQDHHPRGDLPG